MHIAGHAAAQHVQHAPRGPRRIACRQTVGVEQHRRLQHEVDPSQVRHGRRSRGSAARTDFHRCQHSQTLTRFSTFFASAAAHVSRAAALTAEAASGCVTQVCAAIGRGVPEHRQQTSAAGASLGKQGKSGCSGPWWRSQRCGARGAGVCGMAGMGGEHCGRKGGGGRIVGCCSCFTGRSSSRCGGMGEGAAATTAAEAGACAPRAAAAAGAVHAAAVAAVTPAAAATAAADTVKAAMAGIGGPAAVASATGPGVYRH